MAAAGKLTKEESEWRDIVRTGGLLIEKQEEAYRESGRLVKRCAEASIAQYNASLAADRAIRDYAASMPLAKMFLANERALLADWIESMAANVQAVRESHVELVKMIGELERGRTEHAHIAGDMPTRSHDNGMRALGDAIVKATAFVDAALIISGGEGKPA